MRERIMKRAKIIGFESLAERLLAEGKGEKEITDEFFKEAVRRGYAAGSGKAIDQIDDETLVRALTGGAAVINLD